MDARYAHSQQQGARQLYQGWGSTPAHAPPYAPYSTVHRASLGAAMHAQRLHTFFPQSIRGTQTHTHALSSTSSCCVHACTVHNNNTTLPQSTAGRSPAFPRLRLDSKRLLHTHPLMLCKVQFTALRLVLQCMSKPSRQGNSPDCAAHIPPQSNRGPHTNTHTHTHLHAWTQDTHTVNSRAHTSFPKAGCLTPAHAPPYAPYSAVHSASLRKAAAMHAKPSGLRKSPE
jgi:hypothetical protein